MDKHCNKCNTTKPVADFGKRSASKDGLSAWCKSCQSEYDKKRALLPHRVSGRARYAKTESGIAAAAAAKAKYAAKAEHKKKIKAAQRVNNALRDGHIKRKPCEICRREKVVAHHDDYNYALEVRWLCHYHHKQWHKENGEGANAA